MTFSYGQAKGKNTDKQGLQCTYDAWNVKLAAEIFTRRKFRQFCHLLFVGEIFICEFFVHGSVNDYIEDMVILTALAKIGIFHKGTCTWAWWNYFLSRENFRLYGI